MNDCNNCEEWGRGCDYCHTLYRLLKQEENKMKVKAIWEFEVDSSDFDKEHVNINGLCVDLTKRELNYCLKHDQLTSEDFNYEVQNDFSNIRFSGVIDANTTFELENVSEEQLEGINKFIKALANARCSWVSDIKIEEVY